jgi:hypothetical protein
MATITVRKLDQSVIDSLKARAEKNGRSMEEEVRSILSREATDRRLRGQEAVEHFQRFQEKWFPDGPVSHSTLETLREVREEDPTRWDGE